MRAIERGARAQHRFDRQRAAAQGTGEQVFGFEQATQRISGRYLSAVEQRQTFLGRQRQRGETGDCQCFHGVQPLAFVARLAFAQQHQRHVRQRRQVTGGTDRTFERDVRVDLGVDQSDQRVDDLTANAGETTAQAVDLEHHDQAHQLVC
jgi:hypothetical protein